MSVAAGSFGQYNEYATGWIHQGPTVQFPIWGTFFSLPSSTQTKSDVHQMDTRGSFARGKVAGMWRSPLTSS